jgi:hypothetical protein
MITFADHVQVANGREGDGHKGIDEEAGASVADDGTDTELAVDIIESVQLSTSARITCLSAWCKTKETQSDEPTS